MKLNILFGGKAGQGANILSNVLGEALVRRGYYVFIYRDYQSLIRGGHNFNVLTFSDKPVNSNDSKMDVVVALDKKTVEMHKKDLKDKENIIEGEGEGNMYFAGRLFKMLCLDFSVLEDELKRLGKRLEENLQEARKGYDAETKKVCELPPQKGGFVFMNGNKGIADGAIKSGLDVYYAYPMTPATNVMGELAELQIEKNHIVLELENEIAVINAGIGSAMTGAKTMIGTSGGGFDLMTEGFSLAGIAETPLVVYLSSRPGPSTGVATYSGQGDLDMARHAGHGEYPRMVLAPGDAKECEELTNQAFYFSQKFGVPVILLADKHIAECLYTLEGEGKIVGVNKSHDMKRYNSYETDEHGCATEDAEKIAKNVEERLKKFEDIEKEAEKFKQFEIFGKKDSENVIVSWGSPKGAILDAIEDLDCKFVQLLYLDPLPKIKKELEVKNLILIESNATAQLGKLIAEKTGIFVEDKNKILRYDGRPFWTDELKEEIRRRLK